MDAFIEAFSAGVDAVDSFVWGWAMIVLLLGTHIVMTVRTGFIQRKIGTAIKLSISKQDSGAQGDVSQFGALTAALAATIGTGNIVGVATGLFAGGPGAIFWMWIIGVFGIATKYAETYISVKYRVKDANGEMLGGAMYALERGFKNKQAGKILAILFAVFAFVASFGIGASVQSNALTGVVTAYIPGLEDPAVLLGTNSMIGVILVILVGIVIIGGIKGVTRVTEKLVPVMAVLYTAGCLVIIFMNWAYVGEAIGLILTCAFTGQAAFGGAVGSGVALALQFGFKRGLFSNESGLGSAPLVAANATTKNPARQALVSMSGTFWDTVIICAITGIMLVSTMLANPSIEAMLLAGQVSEWAKTSGIELATTDPSAVVTDWTAASTEAAQMWADLPADMQDLMTSQIGQGNFITAAAQLTTSAFATIPVLGPVVLAVGMILFSYSTMLGWSTYGNRAVMYLFGKKGIKPYQVVFLIFVFWGCLGGGELVWNISDITNALMAIPNCIAVLVLGGVIAAETKHYVYGKNLDEVDDTPIPTVDTVDLPSSK
ncbi:MAG: sodium:alanine symporter family protein [Coriobacteriales bacterium]|nr:sodium:alanine symporter family protein [Coriobacteriales bacterium]